MRPGVTRPITGTVTTDTALYKDIGGQISWQSSAGSPKIETLMGCDNTINGLTITVIDGQGTADTLPITVNAAAGNVAGTSSTQITARHQGAIFACDGAAANWLAVGTLPGSGAIAFPQIVSEQTCPANVSGSGAAKTFTPVCAVSTMTIDTGGQTILVPSNMPASGGMSTYTLDITYSGNVSPAFGAGTEWAGGVAPQACSSVMAGCLSSISGLHDRIVGHSVDATHIVYGSPITNYGVPRALPLDITPAAAFAYGLAKLRTGYTGAAANIRRAAGTPPTSDIGFDASGNFDAATFATFCGGTTCFLTTWYDQSGSGIGNCVQSTAANQPQVTLLSLGGRASLATNGSAGSKYCSIATNSLLDFTGSGHTVLFVLQYTATTDGGGTAGGRGDALEIISHFNPTGFYPGWAVDMGDTGRAGAILVYTSNGSASSNGGAFGHLTSINDGAPHFAGWSFASGTVNVYHDAASYTSLTTFLTPASSGQPTVVLAANDTPIDGFFSGNLSEIYGWAATLSPAVISAIQAGAARYY